MAGKALPTPPDVGPSGGATDATDGEVITEAEPIGSGIRGAWKLLPPNIQKLLKLQGYTAAGFNRYAAEDPDALEVIIRSALKVAKFRGPKLDKAVETVLTGLEQSAPETAGGDDEYDPATGMIKFNAEESIQSELVSWWVDHFGNLPPNQAMTNMSKVIAGTGTILDFQAWASTQTGFTPTEDDLADKPEMSQLEQDKRQKYYDIWGYEPPKGYMKDFEDMNPLEFEAYERAKPEFNKTETFRREREDLRAVHDEVFGTVRSDTNRFGFDDSTNDGVRHAGFLGAPPAKAPAAFAGTPWSGGDPSVFSEPSKGGNGGGRGGGGGNKPPKHRGKGKYKNSTRSGEPLDGEGPGR